MESTMRQFKKLLVVPATLAMVDPAVQRGLTLAKAGGSRMTIFWPQSEGTDGGTGLEYFPEILAELKAQLDALTLAANAQYPGHIDSRFEQGKVLIEVMRCVQNEGYDLVLKTARGQLSGRQSLFGSDALHLLRKCPVPVWIVGDQRRKGSGVLVAIDPMAADDESKLVTQKILQIGSSLSAIEQVDLHVIHAWESPNDKIKRNLSWLTPKLLKDMPDDESIGQRHASEMESVVAPFRQEFPDMTTHLLRGPPEHEIPRLTFELNVGTLVMATMARSGVPGLLIGNTAEIVISECNRSVLVVKPDQFKTPLQIAPK